MDLDGLNEKFKSMIEEQSDIWERLKPIDRRLPVLKKHIEQADLYLKFKGKKVLKEAEPIHFTAAKKLPERYNERSHDVSTHSASQGVGSVFPQRAAGKSPPLYP